MPPGSWPRLRRRNKPMTALVILAAVVLALVLLGQIRLGAAVDYTAQGL